MPDIGFVNGRFMPLAEALVPVEDRGYLWRRDMHGRQ